jgi:hypothetical protein
MRAHQLATLIREAGQQDAARSLYTALYEHAARRRDEELLGDVGGGAGLLEFASGAGRSMRAHQLAALIRETGQQDAARSLYTALYDHASRRRDFNKWLRHARGSFEEPCDRDERGRKIPGTERALTPAEEAIKAHCDEQRAFYGALVTEWANAAEQFRVLLRALEEG